MSYKVIEKNEYGVLVIDNEQNQDIRDVCNKCKYLDNCNNEWMKCIRNTYYIPDSEAAKLESELTPETFTLNDMYVESKLLFNCQDQLKDLQNENNQLKEKINELETTIENNVTELIHRTGDLTHDFWYFCAECLENFEMDENFNYCPNCGRKIIRQ